MKLYNTLSRETEEFKPISSNQVKLYACGLTVYSQPHIGNWVPYIYWDVLVRALRASGLEVNHVQNITDVGHLTSDEDAGEDKMMVGALKEGLSAWQVADKYIDVADKEAYELLNLSKPDHLMRATHYIAQQIEFVKELEAKGFTYAIADGVYFDTSKLDNYGQLARLDIEGLQFGARVADTGKKNPTDFAVWKLSDPNEKRDMEWDSPWGKGFPGWHLECSAMAREVLGDHIDIHTGGIDHIPVHHTNEIAQTEALTGSKFANFWVHANHLKVNGTKISKSLGNIYTLEDVINKGFDLQAFKLLVLSKHYRTEGNFTWDILEAAQNRLNGWLSAADLIWQPELLDHHEETEHQDFYNQIQEALSGDLNTPKALTIIDGAIEQAKEFKLCSQCLEKLIKDANKLLGLDLLKNRSDINDGQKQLIKEREVARKDQDWERSDELRTLLSKQGIEVSDTPKGTAWNRTIDYL